MEIVLFGLGAALLLFAVVVFFRMAYDLSAIRQMLQNTGLFSGIPCRWCRMPVPEGAEVCGHCGRDLARVGAP
jgi:hypothetical protein